MPNYYVFIWGHKPDPNDVEVVLVCGAPMEEHAKQLAVIFVLEAFVVPGEWSILKVERLPPDAVFSVPPVTVERWHDQEWLRWWGGYGAGGLTANLGPEQPRNLSAFVKLNGRPG